MKALVHGTLIDGTGTEPVLDATVIVDDDGRIVDVGVGIDPPRGAEVIDVSGRTILPGLIDCHVHFFLQFGRSMQEEALTPLTLRVFEAAERARATLDAGVTSVRDAGMTPRGFKMAAQRGLIASPRLNVAVTIMSQTGGHQDTLLPSGIRTPLATALSDSIEWPNRVCDGIDGVVKTTREVLRAGADFIKICATGGIMAPGSEPTHTQFTREEITAVVYEAQAQGKYVAAHAQGLQGIKNAVESGARTIEHGIYVDEETADDMVRRGTYLVPTFHALQGVLKADAANPGSILPQSLRKTLDVIDIHKANIRMAIEKGVKVAMGTDAGIGLHGANAEELTHMVDLGGMSPMQAIVAATKTAAECNRMGDEVGTLKPGMLADLLVVEGDPLSDISILEDKSNLAMIMQGGNAHKDLITN
jgi:imidazolonepropionase-like amidohydrolase